MRITSHFYYLLKELTYYGINVSGFSIRRELAFMVLKVVNLEDYNLWMILIYNK